MRLGLGNSLARMGMRFGSAGPEAAYIAALTAAGATVTAPKQAAISSFMSGEIAAGRWDGIKRLYFPVWGLAAANAICMKSLATGTWTGGAVTHAAGYVLSSRHGGGYMSTNTNFGALGITKDTFHFAVVYKTTPFGGDNYTDVSFGSANTYFGVEDGNLSPLLGGTYLYADYAPLRVFSFGGNASSQYLKNRNSEGVTNLLIQSEVISNAFDSSNIYFLRFNGHDKSSESQTGLLSLGTTLTTEQDTAYTLALKTLWETTTGLTLP